MSKYFLSLYKDDSWRNKTGQYTLNDSNGFRSWSDRQNDNVSSFRFRLPRGSELRLHEHRSRTSRYQAWRGTGSTVNVNKNQMHGFVHDDASAHSWRRVGYKTIPGAFRAIREKEATRFLITNPYRIAFPTGHTGDKKHQQSIQKLDRGGFVVSGSARHRGYIYLTDKANRIVKLITPAKGKYNHLGGIQVAGNYLAAGYEHLEAKESGKSCILFYDIRNIRSPKPLPHLTIVRNTPGDTAGAVALIKMRNFWLVGVANWDAKKVDFYRSNRSTLATPTTSFGSRPFATWNSTRQRLLSGSVDYNWAPYQNINFFTRKGVTPSLSDLWMIGMHTNIYQFQADWADLYKVQFHSRGVSLKKSSKKHFVRMGEGPRFRHGSGVYYDRTFGTFEVYACEANIQNNLSVRCNSWV